MVESDIVRKIRLLSQEVYKGGDASPFAFCDLVGQLLRLTVAESSGFIVVNKSPVDTNVFVIDGWKKMGRPIVLNDGSFLAIAFTLP